MSAATEWKMREILFTLSRMFYAPAASILSTSQADEALDARALAIWAMWQVGIREDLQRPMGGRRAFKPDFILKAENDSVWLKASSAATARILL